MGRYPPGPRDRAFGLRLARQMRRNPLEILPKWGQYYGDLTHLRVAWLHVYLVNHPDLIREVLITQRAHFRKLPRQTRILRTVDGNGLVVSEGALWLRQRRLLQPLFYRRRLEPYGQVIVHFTQRMLDRWQSTTEVDMADEMTHLTLAIIAHILFGVDLSADAPRFAEAVQVLSTELEREFVAPVVWPDWMALPSKRRKRAALNVVDELIRGLIRQRVDAGHDASDVLSMLLAAVDAEGDGSEMTEKQVRDEAMTLFNAGHDTTASALMWTWSLLATYPQVEARTRDEVRTVLGDRVATSADVNKLPYLTMVIKEALRLYPPTVALLGRQATWAVELGRHHLAKGSWVYLMPYVTQRDPRFFPDPELFDPERFSPGRIEQIPSHAFFPFGAGPHVCIGQQLAMQEMALVIATVIRQVQLSLVSPPDAIEPELRLSIRPKGGLPMRWCPVG